ncbi:hypothetical protein Golomagni_07866 [Golovinomyces magnicellulatus]|nr:hypothetical protein Golomagni_07866 [Golovinomyces magnicellulatus]
MVCNIGGAECHSYGAQMVTRALTAAFISPPIGIGSGIVAQLSTPEEYARKLGWWVLLTILGTSAGPLIMGFVVQYTRVEFIYWIFAGMNLLLALGYVLLGIETRRAPEGTRGAEDFASPVHSFAQRLRPRRIDPRPIKASDFVVPLRLVKNPRILMSALATTVSFCYANIVLVVEMPIAFGEKFHLDAQATGLQFIPVIIGCVIGEQVGGPLSDYFMKVSRKRNGHVLPGHRLWLTYIGFATIFAGLLVWGFQLEHSESWNVTPCIGVAIASFGNQIQSTILTAYAIDSSPRDAASVGVFFNLTRLLFGFTGPFYFPYMFESLGFIGAAGLMCGLVVIGGLIPVVVVHAVGSRKPPSDNA